MAFLTNPERMAELRKALLDLAADHKTIPQYFQRLLTTTVENPVPGKSSLVAIRIVSASSPSCAGRAAMQGHRSLVLLSGIGGAALEDEKRNSHWAVSLK
jgi:hypothetical protein